MKLLTPWVVLVAMVGGVSAADAQQIYKCADGAYQQTPCPNGAKPEKVYTYSPEPDSAPLKITSKSAEPAPAATTNNNAAPATKPQAASAQSKKHAPPPDDGKHPHGPPPQNGATGS